MESCRRRHRNTVGKVDNLHAKLAGHVKNAAFCSHFLRSPESRRVADGDRGCARIAAQLHKGPHNRRVRRYALLCRCRSQQIRLKQHFGAARV